MAMFLACSINRLRRRIGNASRRGSVIVEMALIAPVFFLMLMGITESCLMLGAQQLLESAAFNASRLAKTGYISGSQTQSQTVMQVLINELQNYGGLITTANVTMTEISYTSFSASGAGTGGTSGFGAPQQIVVYTVTYPWKLFTPMMSAFMGSGGIVNLTSTIVVRNEPYG